MNTFALFSLALTASFALLVSVTGAPGPALEYPVVRETYPNDVEGIWNLAEETGGQSVCPDSIEHTTYTGSDGGVLILPHNTIEQDGERCDSVADEKRLEVYESDKYDSTLDPIDESIAPLPAALERSLTRNGRVVDAFTSLNAAGERYMIGFEPKVRVCNKVSTIFKANTTLFFARPFDGTINIKNLDTDLQIGFKYMLIIPPNQAIICLYSVNIDASPDVAIPSESEEMLPTSDPISSSSPTISEEMSPATVSASPTVGMTMESTPMASPLQSEDENQDSSPSPTASSDPAQGESDSSPAPDEGDEGDDVCFPSDTQVTLSNGQRVRIDALQPGQDVSVGGGKFSRVYGFSHNDAHTLSHFIILSTESGHTLRATSGHFVYVNGLPTMMSRASIGDTLTLHNGKTSKIIKIDTKLLRGLYNPQTVDGNIVVNGVLATTFTAAVRPVFANAALLPLRAVQRLFGGDWVSLFTGASARRLLVWLPNAIST